MTDAERIVGIRQRLQEAEGCREPGHYAGHYMADVAWLLERVEALRRSVSLFNTLQAQQRERSARKWREDHDYLPYPEDDRD